MHLKQL